jgi:hypothetical protein
MRLACLSTKYDEHGNEVVPFILKPAGNQKDEVIVGRKKLGRFNSHFIFK